MHTPPPATSINHLRSPTYSLVHWLNLAGVSIEVGNQPAVYQMPPIPDFDQPVAVSSVQPAGSAAAPRSAPQVKIEINKFNSLEELNNFCASWKNIGLAKTASRAVAGQGKQLQPRLMVIGDIPDDAEDRSGEAFSGTTSHMVKQALTFAGIPQAEIYYTYLSKWRTPAKRNLTPPERDICAQILLQEVGFVRPDLILALGDAVHRVILGDSAPSATKLPSINSFLNQSDNKKITVLASQKPEVLVKNPLMKKSFWFGLIDLARSNRT